MLGIGPHSSLLRLYYAVRKYIKNQKSVWESIARMSSKPLFRIQDDIINHRQQLLLITSGLQRNAVAIEKLKKETAQVLFSFQTSTSVYKGKSLTVSIIYQHYYYYSRLYVAKPSVP